MNRRMRKKAQKRSMWYELFGTPERAAETLSQRELACTSSHVGVACFGLDECSVCPFRDGLCGQGNVAGRVEPSDFGDVLDMLKKPYRDTRVKSIGVDQICR